MKNAQSDPSFAALAASSSSLRARLKISFRRLSANAAYDQGVSLAHRRREAKALLLRHQRHHAPVAHDLQIVAETVIRHEQRLDIVKPVRTPPQDIQPQIDLYISPHMRALISSWSASGRRESTGATKASI